MTDTTDTTAAIAEKTGSQLVAEYNGLVAKAVETGLDGYRPVTRFMDRESAEKRITALESSIRAREAGLSAPKGGVHNWIDPRETGGCNKSAGAIECHLTECVKKGACAHKRSAKNPEEAFEATESELREQASRPKNHDEQPEEDTKKMMKKIKAKMKKLAKPAKEPKVAKAPKAKAAKKAPRTNGNGSKTAEVGRLLKRKGGCTRTDILAATGWTQVSVPAMAAACGLTLRQERAKGELTRYWGE